MRTHGPTSRRRVQAVLGLARQARGCELKLAAVREMLGEQAAQLLGGDGWDSGSSGLDADELPHRDEAPPQRIVQVRPPLPSVGPPCSSFWAAIQILVPRKHNCSMFLA